MPNPTSPITNSRRIRLIKTIPSKKIIAQYQKDYQLDIRSYFLKVPQIKIYECLDSHYRFYFPALAAKGQFYQYLQNNAPFTISGILNMRGLFKRLLPKVKC